MEDRSYRWVVLAVCFLMVFVCLGFCSSSKSLYLAAITQATGIRRSLFAVSDSCRYVTTAVVNLFFGALIARFGAKRLVAAGFASLIAFALIYAWSEQAWQFCVGGCFLGLGLSWTTTTMVGHVIGAWFRERRGTMMGFVLASNGLGGALAMQIVSPIINRQDTAFGYRSAYLLVAAILAGTGLIVLLLFRPYPRGGNAEVRKKRAPGGAWEGVPFSEARRTPYLYAALGGIFLTGMTLQSISSISAAHMRDVGLDAEYIAAVLSFYSLCLAALKFGVGVLHDRIGLRRTMLICDAASVAAILLLALVAPTKAGRAVALGYAVLSSLAMPLETIMLPLLAADLFGERSFGKLLGIVVSVNTAGYAVGAPLTNLCYDLLGTYRPVLFALGGVMAVMTAAFQLILRAADRKRRAMEQAPA